jgi:hypothetical protein
VREPAPPPQVFGNQNRRSAADPQCGVPKVRSLIVCDGHDAVPVAARMLVAAHTGRGPALTPELADQAIVDLAAGDGHDQDAYVPTAAGLRSLS